jgi:hypothetical protein
MSLQWTILIESKQTLTTLKTRLVLSKEKKTFSAGIETDNIDDISGAGVKIGGVTLKNGIVYGLVWGA